MQVQFEAKIMQARKWESKGKTGVNIVLMTTRSDGWLEALEAYPAKGVNLDPLAETAKPLDIVQVVGDIQSIPGRGTRCAILSAKLVGQKAA